MQPSRQSGGACHYTTDDGDFTQVFENRDIGDKNAVLALTNH